MSDMIDIAADLDEAYRAKVKRVALAVAETLAKFRDDVPLDGAISALVWVLAGMVVQKPEACPGRVLADQVAELLRTEIAEHRRASASKPVLH